MRLIHKKLVDAELMQKQLDACMQETSAAVEAKYCADTARSSIEKSLAFRKKENDALMEMNKAFVDQYKQCREEKAQLKQKVKNRNSALYVVSAVAVAFFLGVIVN